MRRDLSIGDVAQRAGLAASAIRYYERMGLVPEPPRVGGQRRYDEAVLRRLKMITVAKRAGFSLEEIRTLLHGPSADGSLSNRWRRLAEEKLAEMERKLDEIEAAREILLQGMRCGCYSEEDCPACGWE